MKQLLLAAALIVLLGMPAGDSATTSLSLPMAPQAKVGPAEIYPDSTRTPGAINTAITQANISQNICNKNWTTGEVRPANSVTKRVKKQTMQDYGFTDAANHYELDHLISLQNGGCPACVGNLWPEAYGDLKHHMTEVMRGQWNKENPGSSEVLLGALEKDVVESHIHDEICRDIPNAKLSSYRKKFPPTVTVTLQRGQEILTTDWYACYLNMMDGNKPCN